MQINLTGFLTKDTPEFMAALWKLLVEAQESAAGVPISMVEAKKEEMRQARAGDTRAIEERDRRARLDEIRASERDGRGARGGGRGRGRGRGRGGGGPMDSNRPRDGGWGGRGGVSHNILTPGSMTEADIYSVPVPVLSLARLQDVLALVPLGAPCPVLLHLAAIALALLFPVLILSLALHRGGATVPSRQGRLLHVGDVLPHTLHATGTHALHPHAGGDLRVVARALLHIAGMAAVEGVPAEAGPRLAGDDG